MAVRGWLMINIRLLFFTLCIILAGCATTPSSSPDSLLSKLQKGGYVIFFRHAATDHTQKDTDLKNPTNCVAQRRLDERGREQSRIIGEGFKAKAIPVGKILSSQFCRCTNTAKIAFGRVETSIDITSIQGVTQEERKRRVIQIRKLLNTPPEPGTNTVLVAHKWMFKDASGLLLQEGEAAIFKPRTNADVAEFIQQVKPQEWQQLN